MSGRLTRIALLTAGALAASAAPAVAANLTVAPRAASMGCAQHTPLYTSVEAAVTAASPGDQITVCAGTYQETVLINKANLQIKSDGNLPGGAAGGHATIKAPTTFPTATGAVIEITAPGVKLQNLNITGSAARNDGGTLNYGVLIDGGATNADLEQVDISNINNPLGSSSSQRAKAIDVESPGSAPQNGGQPTLTLKQSTIENYQKDGVLVEGAGASADMEQNTLSGVGPTTQVASNGIVIASGAIAKVQNNTINNNIFVGSGSGSGSGVFLCGAGANTDIENNVVSTNDFGIYDAGGAGSAKCPQGAPQAMIKNNTVTDSTFDGVALDTVNGNVPGNNGPQPGTQVQNDTSVGAWGHGEYGNYNGDGFGLYQTTGALLQGDMANGNSEDGLHALSSSTGNTFKDGQAFSNLVFDCQDQTGTSTVLNTWMNDKGDLSMPTFLCKGDPTVAAAGTNPAASSQALASSAAPANQYAPQQ